MQELLSRKFVISWDFTILLVCAILMLPLKLVFSWILAAAIHEICHITALRYFNIRIFRVVLKASGAYMETDSIRPKEEIICALAGPLGGIAGTLMYKVNAYFAVFCFAQTLFNLLPVFPADGGRVLRSVLTIFFGVRKGITISSYITKIVFFLAMIAILIFQWVNDFAISIYIILPVIIFFLILKYALQSRRNNCTM